MSAGGGGERASGILLHPSSLPGPLGSGDFGEHARRFVDWLAQAGLSLWQMLPLAPAGNGDSPYMSPSAFALDPLFIDLFALRDAGWLRPDALDSRHLPEAFAQSSASLRSRFDISRQFRMQALREAAQAFFAAPAEGELDEFNLFCAAEAHWLDDYSLFMAISVKRPGERWQQWSAPIRDRKPAALARLAGAYGDETRFWRFTQWLAARQWSALRAYANARGVRIIGDVPIFVSEQSADVWAHPQLFELDAGGEPLEVAGVPPDYFSATGQRWGNPLYAWDAHRAQDFAWWVARLRQQHRLADMVRIDHFRGFAAYWSIPVDAPDATAGRWQPGPGAELFNALHAALGRLPIIAEDLGTITPDVVALREEFALPGMRVLQFAFGGGADHAYLPHNYGRDSVVYTGTHDNDTAQGWFATASAPERRFAQIYCQCDGRQIHWDLIRAASGSVADLAIWPMQDVLGLGTEARMNRPGSATGNWDWRFDWAQIAAWDTARLREIAAVHGRNGATLPD